MSAKPELQRRPRSPTNIAGFIISLLAVMPLIVAADGSASPRQLVDIGRRIYEDGVLPGGEPLRGVRPEGFTLEGSYAACVTCHRRSGMGSIEGSIDSTVMVPPIAGPVLFAPSRFAGIYLNPLHHYVPTASWNRALTRPAYDLASLGHALREGVDPAGRPLTAPMPRYKLDDAVLGVLQAWADAAQGAGTPWRLMVWRLSGPAANWDSQLETYYRDQPAFAVLSGAGGVEWGPVDRFCERHRVPCVLPSVEVAPAPATGYYAMYFSPGVDLEAAVLARHLQQSPAVSEDGAMFIQVYADSSGRHAAEKLRARLGVAGKKGDMRKFRRTAPLAALDALSASDILILWLRPDQINQIAAQLPEGPGTGTVYISALLASPEALVLPAAWKRRVRYVSLFDDLGLQGEIARLRLQRWLEMQHLAGRGNRRVQADAYAACYLFNDALSEIRQQEVRRPAVPLNREQVIETLEDLVNKYNDSTDLIDPDSHVAYYGRMSLGPGQRIAVRGGTIMRYASPESDKLIAVGKRIVP
jgi:hypothetical protein